MGNRVSISFVNGNEESVALFNHWDGMEFVSIARNYAKELQKEVGSKVLDPLDRLEPNTVMVDFIRHITQNMTRVSSNLYLGKDSNDGDDSDNGHHKINLTKRR
jgi:hypothetical protein